MQILASDDKQALVSMAEITREFFERPENDDTLQNIRRQYLESKRNLQDLMMKQGDEETKIRTEFVSSSKTPREPENKPVPSDSLMMMNEIRSLRSLVYEQQAQMRRLQADLQSHKNAEFDLQHNFTQLQSQVRVLEADLAAMRRNYMSPQPPQPLASYVPPSHYPEYRSPLDSPIMDDNTTRLIRISGPRK